ncbi:hypothetical protein BpHYR1_020661 [Brachionus plicatilis]|uniref:Transmembrane protein n=1 Tax=Brachionus plicatilis TaxID=10195 RepID=A0A3M7T760_BRAPC|nr:hypothetical protein BpHYR1_020661 [Brachionus plicatilis]
MIVRLIAMIFYAALSDASENLSNESDILSTFRLVPTSLPQLNNRSHQLTYLKKNRTIKIDIYQNNYYQNQNQNQNQNQVQNEQFTLNKFSYEPNIKNVINYIKVFHVKIKKMGNFNSWFYLFVFIMILASLILTMIIVTNKTKDTRIKDEKLREMRNYIKTYREKEFL